MRQIRLGWSSTLLLSCVAVLASACGVLQVDMTSSPDVVHWGDPVTFDVKFTNRSQCPVKQAAAFVEPFISLADFKMELNPNLPPDTPPEVIDFINQLRVFFDDLCSGGTPIPPQMPMTTMACVPNADEVVCTFTGPASQQGNNSGGFTFATLGNRLGCEVDAGTMRCSVHLPRLNGATAGGSGAAMAQSLSCQTAQQLGVPPGSLETEVLCFLGTFPSNLLGLAGGEMATGQFTLPARGDGPVRNLIIGFTSPTDPEDLGVCKGGSNPGAACDLSDTGDCNGGGTCEPGICTNGPNQGKGCDPDSADTDCGMGNTCALCSEPTTMNVLPIDCTSTYVIPNFAPAASPWGLAALAIALCAGGVFWVRRRSA